jgi:glutaminyl-peptide cyclotransferase
MTLIFIHDLGFAFSFIEKIIYRRYGAQIEDDHVPFMRRGVPILHAITVPFPETWHKNGDNAESLHWPTIQNLNTAFRALAADYLGLDV